MVRLLDGLNYIFMALVALFLCFAVANPDAYASSTKSLAIYYGLPAAVLLGLLGIRFGLKPGGRLLVYINGLAILVALFGAEAYFQSRIMVPDQGRTPELLIAQAREEGKNVSPILGSFSYRTGAASKPVIKGQTVVPLAGPGGVMIPRCGTDHDYTMLQLDRYGFVNEDTVWDRPSMDLVLVGDSFTYGACADKGYSFAERLAATVSGTLNLGIGGNGPVSSAIAFAEYAEKYKPKHVVWFFFDNDLEQDIIEEMATPEMARYLEGGVFWGLAEAKDDIAQHARAEIARAAEEKALGKTPAPQPASDEAQNDKGFLSFEGGVSPMTKLRFLTLQQLRLRLGLTAPGGDWAEPDVINMTRALKLVKDRLDQWGGTLTFVMLPDWSRGVEGLTFEERYFNGARQAADTLGLDVIDLTPVFHASDAPEAFFPHGQPGHYGNQGHAMVAEEVLKRLYPSKILAPISQGQ